MAETAHLGIGSNASMDEAADKAAPLILEQGQRLSLSEALHYEHPDYVANVDKWVKYLDAYSANDIYRYIHKHPRESEDMYDVRKVRGYYYNYVASVVDLYVSYLFHAPIERDLGAQAELLEQLHKDADARGTSYSLFIQHVATTAEICGHCAVLVDAPQVPEGGVETEQDRENAGVRPYLVHIKPTQIKDWEVDRNGRFEWVKLQVERPSGRDWRTQVDTETCYYVIWYRDHWEEYEVLDDDARIIAEGPNPLGEVPLVIVRSYPDREHTWFGVSSVRDIVDINLALLNWSSMGDEEIAERCLNILAMERDESGGTQTLSHHNVLEYASGTQPPQYLVPGETPLKLIGEWIDRAKDEIYRLAKLGGSTGLLGVREATSGIAYAYEFNETNQSLSRKAACLEQAEKEIHRLYLKWLKKEYDGTIIYPREFGVDDFLLEFQVLSEAKTLLTSETAKKELEKKLANKLFSRESSELRDTIREEIETADPEPMGMIESFGTMPMQGGNKPSSVSRGAEEETGDSSGADSPS